MFEKTKINVKEIGVGPFFKKKSVKGGTGIANQCRLYQIIVGL